MMRTVWLLVALLARPALGFDSVCFVGPGEPGAGDFCKPGPQAARNRWRGPSDEHRALLEFARIFGGLPHEVSEDFTLTVFTSDEPVDVAGASKPSLEPVNFFDAVSVQARTMSVPEFAQLPDHGYALWDWARGLELCPLPVAANASDCHDFVTHMGAVNSNHFLPQAEHFYRYYHQLALARAAACRDAETRITNGNGNPGDFRDFLRACEDEALVLEATGQHFLEDAWSTGHMWERWGSPDLADFPSISEALLVAMTSGLIHGAKAVLQDLPVSHPDISAALATAGFDVTQYTFNDPLCAPAPEVSWVGPSQATPAPGAGDLFLNELIANQGATFPAQFRQLFSCAASGLRAVYQAAGEQHGPLAGGLAPGLAAVDPTSAACFGQRATNRAMDRGIGLDFTDPNGQPQRIELNSTLASFLVPALSTQAGASVTPFTVIQYRIGMGFVVTQAKLRDLFAPDETDLAQGGMGSFLGIDRNLVYVKTPLAPYVDPPLPWPAAGAASGADAERATWLARTFHRAHAVEWCNRFRPGDADFLDVDALRSKVETLRQIGAPAAELAAACAACTEFAARHLRVGTSEADHDTTREPLCRFLVDPPASPQFVYQRGNPGDDVGTLAKAYCGCACPSVFTGSVSDDTDQTPFTDETGSTRHGFEHNRYNGLQLTRLPDRTFTATGTFQHDSLDELTFPGDPGETCRSTVRETGSGTVTGYTGNGSDPEDGSLEATATITRTFDISPCRGEPGSTEVQPPSETTFRTSLDVVTPTVTDGCLTALTWSFFFFDPASNTTDSTSGQVTGVP